jgi:hypothetical protein
VSFAKFNDSLKYLFFGVHHERPVLHDQFAEGLPTITGESNTLIPSSSISTGIRPLNNVLQTAVIPAATLTGDL